MTTDGNNKRPTDEVINEAQDRRYKPEQSDDHSKKAHDISTEKAFTTKDICSALGVAQSTARGYCSALESEGYTIMRDDHNRRVFVAKDLDILRRLQDYVKGGKLTVEQASKALMQTNTPAPNNNEQLTELNARMDRLEQFNRELLRKLDDNNRELKEAINGRDQKLLDTMSDMQAEKKKGWLSRLFKL